ncbi:RHS repeat-associated core domain-containing protein [Cellulomonas sp. FA1]|uniref:RHS repeat-associated core domain-containing protein n=1 Tax=Cellulomonas sp. FA1 TaxID=1346710 RepID=UPI00128BA175|nr:RHS repeat-associated core domain-containing protein [Cellulomonas sp. FA1]
MQYDADGRPVATTDPLGRTSSTTYDAAGRPVATVDTSGGTTTTAYDATGLPTSVTAPDGAETAYGYDAAGRVAERVDPLGRSTGYAYDAVGRVVGQTDPLGRVTRTTYDAAGNVATIVRPSGTQTTGDPDDGTITFDHDEAGRVTARSFSDGTAAFGYEYSAAGRLVTASRTAGGTVTSATTYGYDQLGRTVSAERTGPGAVAAAYSYTSAGRLAGAAWSTGQSVSYSYNQVGQLVEVVPEGPGGLTPVSYAYDAAGNRVATNMTGAPSSGTQVVYDLAGQVSTVKHAVGASTTLRYDLVRDVRGNPTLVTEQADGVVTRTAYEYDGVGRLTAQCSPAIGSSGGCAGLVPGSWFSYDQMGNRTSETVRSGFGQWAGVVRTDSVYDEADQLVSQSVGAVQVASFGWSPEGALVSSSSAAGDRSWVSDLSGELVSVVLEDGRVVGFEHDGEGNRVARSVDGVVDASWAWDSTVAGVPVRVGQSAPGGAVVSWLPDVLSGVGAPLAQVSVAGAGSWLLADPFSSVVASVPAGSGVVAGSARFDAFGVPVVPASGALVGQGVGFAGQYLDGVVGAYDMRARDYVASWGRFTSADPVAVPVGMGMVNGYGYAFGNPLVLHDVTGNWPDWVSDVGAAAGGAWQGVGDVASAAWLWVVNPDAATIDLISGVGEAYDQGGVGLAVNQFNPVYGVLDSGARGWDLAQQGCVAESARAFTGATFSAAGTVAIAGGGASWVGRARPGPSPEISGAHNGNGWWNKTNANTTWIPPSGAGGVLPGLPASAPRPLGLGSTGRTVPGDLAEQLAMTEVRSAPGGTMLNMREPMGDPRWPVAGGWVKMSQRVNGIDIHYVRNTVTGAVDDFEFKNLFNPYTLVQPGRSIIQ